MFRGILRVKPVLFFIVVVILFSSAQAQAKEVVWQPEEAREPIFSFNFNLDAAAEHLKSEVREITNALIISPANKAVASVRATTETVRQKVKETHETLVLITPKGPVISPPNLSLSFSSLTPWSQSAQVTQAQAEPSPTNSLPPQDVIEESMQANLLAQANNPLEPAGSFSNPASNGSSSLTSRELLKQEIVSEVLSTLFASQTQYSSITSQAELTAFKNELRSLVSRQSDSDTRARTTVIQNITNTGTLTDPNISGATITSSTFSGTTGTFTSLTSDTVDFDSINGDASTFTDLSFTTATGTSATTTSFFSTNASSTNLATSNFTFGGITGSAWTDFCETITGSSELCDGDDEAGEGGGSSSGSVFVGARGYASANLTIPNNISTSVALNQENFDSDSFHDISTNNTRFTVPTGKAGKYRLTGFARFSANSTGVRYVWFRLNGSSMLGITESGPHGNNATTVTAETVVNLNVGDYVEMMVYQTSGGNLDIIAGDYTAFEMVYEGGTSPLQVFTGARAYKNGSQTINNITTTKIQLDAESFDSDSAFDSTTNYRFTIPSGKAGKYLIEAQLGYNANATGQRSASIYKNGVNVSYAYEDAVSNSFDTFVPVSTVLDLEVGDYIELWGYQNSGSGVSVRNASTETWLSATYLGGSATDLTSMSDGTAATPGGSFNQDSDTGLFRPAANVLGVSTAGVERLRIDGSGNIGLGTTDVEAWWTGTALEMDGAAIYRRDTGTTDSLWMMRNAYYDGGWKYKGTAAASLFEVGLGQIKFFVTSSGTADNAITWTTAFQISFYGAYTQSVATFGGATNDGTAANIFSYQGNNFAGLNINDSSSTSGAAAIQFRHGGTQVGSITKTGSATAYNTSSDQRLKQNISATESGLDLLKQIQVRDYEFIVDPDNRVQGFIAQELNEIYPQAVHIPLNSTDYWSIDYSKLTPLLVQSVQDLDARLTTLEDYLNISTTASTTDSTVSYTTIGTTTQTVTDSSGIIDTLLWAGMQLFERSVKVVEITAEKVVATLGVFDAVETKELRLVGENGEVYCVRVNSSGDLYTVECGAEVSTESSDTESSTEDTTDSTTEETATTTEEVVENDTSTTTEEVVEEEFVAEDEPAEEVVAEDTASTTPVE